MKRVRQQNESLNDVPAGPEREFYAGLCPAQDDSTDPQRTASPYSRIPNPESRIPNCIPVFAPSRFWNQLYHSWNFCFVFSELDDLQFFLPKLLIPSVTGATDEAYMTVRVYALWLVVNFGVFRDLAPAEERVAKVAVDPAVKRQLAEAWGAVNRRYAEQHMRCCGAAESEARGRFEESFRAFFSSPLTNLVKVVGGRY